MAYFTNLITNPAFQHFATKILLHLDSQSLAKCRLLSHLFKEFIDNKKSLLFLQIRQANVKRVSRLVGYKAKMISNEIFVKRSYKRLSTEELWSILIFMKDYCSRISPVGIPYKYNSYHVKINILEYASYHNHIDIVELLLKNSLDVEDINSAWTSTDNVTALHYACGKGNVEIVNLFESYKCIDFNVADEYGRTPLHFTCNFGQNNDKSIMRMLDYPDLPYPNGNEELIKLLLLSPKVSIDLQDVDGRTAFWYACTEGNFMAVKAFLDFATKYDDLVDINLPNDQGWTPFHLVCLFGHFEIAKALVDYHKIKKNVVFNILDNDENNPMHFACESGHVNIVKLLLEFSIQYDVEIGINTAGYHLLTPLHTACMNGRFEVVKILLEYSKAFEINFNATSQLGWTPLFLATHYGDLRMVNLILNSKLDINPNLTDSHGRTPFHVACFEGRFDIVKLMLNSSISNKRLRLNIQDNYGQTAMHLACLNDNFEVIKLILELYPKLEINLNIIDKQGMTPMNIAFNQNHQNIVRLGCKYLKYFKN